MKVSVLYPSQPAHARLVAPFAEFVDRGEAARLWLGQSLGAETHQVFAYLAGAGLGVPVGTSVTLMPLRSAYEAAVQARSLARLTGHPVVAGFGASQPEVVRALRGEPYQRPAAETGAYLTEVRRLLDGEDLRGLRLPPLRHHRVEVGAGVLRPGMARVAGATADVAITWMTPPSYLDGVLLPAMKTGDRKPPRTVAVVHVATRAVGRDPVRLATSAAGHHLRAPHYVDMLRRSGLDVDAADPARGARALVDHGVFTYGEPAEIVARLRGYPVDEVVLNSSGVLFTEGAQAAIDDLALILKTWADTDG